MAETLVAQAATPNALQVGDIIDGTMVSYDDSVAWIDIGMDLPACLRNHNMHPHHLQHTRGLEFCVVHVPHDGNVVLELSPPSAAASNNQRGRAGGRGRGRGRGIPDNNSATANLYEDATSKPHMQYSRGLLLRIRQSVALVPSTDADLFPLEEASSEQLDPLLLKLISEGHLPPKWWRRCGLSAKREALAAALRGSHMHAVYAMQPESSRFRNEVDCVVLEQMFLDEILQQLFADAASSASSSGLLLPPLQWLLEHGADPSILLARPPDGTVHGCLAGLRLLADIGPAAAAALPEVIICASDPDSRIRRTAILTMCSFGESAGDSETVQVLLQKLHDCDHLVREAAARAFGCIGQCGVNAAAALLANEDPEVRGLAATALGVAGARAAAYAEILTHWFEHEGPSLRLSAALALGCIGEAAGDAAAAALALRLRLDADEHVREASATALGQMGTAASAYLDALAVALDDGDPFVQRAAAIAWPKGQT